MRNGLFAVCVFTAMMTTACRSVPIEASSTEALAKDFTKLQVESAIQSALRKYHWKYSSHDDFGLLALLEQVPNGEGWKIEIAIEYDARSYAIKYVDSVAMGYDPSSEMIHENYNVHVDRLKREIDYLLSSMVVASPDAGSETPVPKPGSRVDGPVEPDSTPIESSVFSGSGFFVTSNQIVTNAHVVEGCDYVWSSLGERLSIDVVEPQSDLALLSLIEGKSKKAAALRSGASLRTAEKVMALGFPYGGQVSTDLNLTIGNVSALSGFANDRRFFQLTAPIQPGNSGGPVLDKAGNVVGVVVSQKSAIPELMRSGSVPQNVNFAIALGTLQSFLDSQAVRYETQASEMTIDPSDVYSEARPYMRLIRCVSFH